MEYNEWSLAQLLFFIPTDSKMSRNPFRAQGLSPNPTGGSTTPSNAPSYHSSLPISHSTLLPVNTGTSSASAPPSYRSALQSDPDSDDEESPEALPDLTPRIPSANPSQSLLAQRTGSSASTPNLPNRPFQPPSTAPPSIPPRPRPPPSPTPTPPPSSPPIDDILLSPPPETSAPPAYTPTVRGGESVVELGPRRPFQRAPEPRIQLPAPSLPQQRPAPTPSPPQRPRYQPPRSPPSSRLAIPSERPRPQSQMSDFARDFYSAGTTPPASETSAGEEQERQARPPQPRYAPPPGPPPPPRRPRAASTSSGAGSTAPPTSDGRPTTMPIPGHPLLRNGQTLVYPEGYICPKCVSRSPVPSRFACSPARSLAYSRHPCSRSRYQGQNTGYKSYDPSHPCRKCWDRFGKPYTTVLASSPWGEQGSSSQSSHGRTFQSPLPVFKSPRGRIEPSLPGAYPHSPVSPTNGPVVAMPSGPPPPGATVVAPGDPRIGGRLCWRCGGRGVTPFLIFDELTCETCGGIGRLVN